MTTTDRIDKLQAAYDAATKDVHFDVVSGDSNHRLNPGSRLSVNTNVTWLVSAPVRSRVQVEKDAAFYSLAHNLMPWLLEQARIVERLPKTADGVPIIPNDHVWIVVAAGKVEIYLVESVDIDSDGWHIGITGIDWKDAKSVADEDCFSTRAAAESAALEASQR